MRLLPSTPRPVCRLLLSGAALLLATTCLPAQTAKPADLKWDHMDLGPFQSGTFKVDNQITAKGLAIKLGQGTEQATLLFDTELLRWSAAWTGGFITFPRARGGLEGQIAPAGKVALSTSYAPGAVSSGEVGDDPRDRHLGNLPAGGARWKGLALQGESVMLQYQVGGTTVRETPGFQKVGEAGVFTRHFKIEASQQPLTILLGELAGSNGSAEGGSLMLEEPGKVEPKEIRVLQIAGKNLPAGAKLRVAANGRALLDLPALATESVFQLALWSGMKSDAPRATDIVSALQPPAAAAAPIARWGAPIETTGTLGKPGTAYAVDEIALPENTPYHSWLRPGGHDFLPDGRAVLASLSGDVWLVSGLEGDLQHVRWQRFATGLFQPLGVKVIGVDIYVLGRDQITKFTLKPGENEAQTYECFNNDCLVTSNYHEFALDLQTDSKGNFYFAKGSPWEPNVSTAHQGTLLKISPDGAKLDIVATGLRAPNGLNVGPHDEITVSDNQGHWMPENRLNIIKPGGFYGMVPAAHRTLTFETKEGNYTADPSDPKDQAAHKQNFWGSAQTPRPSEGYDLPLCWMPKPIDNSSGGEVWVPEGTRWGPLGGHMLQMSYGKCFLFDVLGEVADGVPQATLARFPVKFSSGIMRGRFNPADGQLYLSGLNVWQSDASKDGCFYRIRYTGAPHYEPVALRTAATGVELTFDVPLDKASATDAQNFSVQEWNYLWSGAYGSADYSTRDPEKKGRDSLEVKGATLSPDGKKLMLAIEDLRPAMQYLVKYKIKSADGQDLNRELYGTIHRLPKAP